MIPRGLWPTRAGVRAVLGGGALALTAGAALTACSAAPEQPSAPLTATPPAADQSADAALAALARAINERDDAAVRRLVCAAARNDALTFQEARAELAEVDSRLADVRYQARDWRITARAGSTAVATMTIGLDGVPADLSAAARAALSSVPAPVPLNMFDLRHQINLVREGGVWVACGPLGVRHPD